MKILFILSFLTSFTVLYFLYRESYERTWKGRVYYLFFLWLASLELILKWEKIDVKVQEPRSKRFIISIITALLPTIYVFISNFSGLNALIMEISPKHYGLDWWSKFMPLTIEYLVFTVLSLLLVVLIYGIKGLRRFALPITLLGVVGLIFLIDNLYPFGEFSPFQIFVPTTTMLAANLLTLMGYQTELKGQAYKVPILRVQSDMGEASFGIAWPCSGIDSLLIYSLVTILFIEDNDASLRQKAAYFLIGAVITYFINALRIAEIFILAIKYGATSLEVQRFHDHYGPLYSIIWIIVYQVIMIGVQFLRRKASLRHAAKDL
ncbi:archaeosortase/exosortase family protein [Candidatus Bathyarchaeota archaeon]|nr:archaeosortase/exosortase family protein [Candidatus Bathyarchaeota archaeon]